MKFLLAVLFTLPLIIPLSSQAATYSVNWFNTDQADYDTSDNVCDITSTSLGRCTLRAAIEQANAHAGADTIVFSELPTNASSVVVIHPNSALPDISGSVIIDGRTANGYNDDASILNAVPRIYISGNSITASPTNGFSLIDAHTNDSQIHAIGIIEFTGRGILVSETRALTSQSGIYLSGNWIGVNSDGSSAGNGSQGVGIYRCSGCKIGGSLPETTVTSPGNLISSNGTSGIYIASGDVEISGNSIGVDPAGSRDFGNGGSGIWMKGRNNIVKNNVIANNSREGLWVEDGADHQIVNNDIVGNSESGLKLGHYYSDVTNSLVSNNKVHNNLLSGIHLKWGTFNEIAGNKIFDNDGNGITISEGESNQILGNEIGMSMNGENRANNQNGIYIEIGSNYSIIDSNWVGFNSNGISLDGNGATVCGNHIGVGASGEPAGNLIVGILVIGNNNLIGDTRVNCTSNIIGHNSAVGVEIFWGQLNTVRNNQIGGLGFGNHGTGVFLNTDALSNDISENDISYNASRGISTSLTAATGNRFEKNSYKGNVNINIDLGNNGVTANDPGDADTGPNNLQNTPIVTAMTEGVGKLQITYRINSTTTASAYPLATDFYIDGASTDNRKTFLQRDIYNESPNAEKSITVTLPIGVATGTLASMTTDNNGNSSEFSWPFEFEVEPGIEDIFEDSFEDAP